MSGSSRAGLASAFAKMFSGTLVSRILGMVRAVILVAALGSAFQADAFNLANTLPNTFYNLLAGGVLNAILVPQIVRAMRRTDGDAYVNKLLTISGLLLFGVTVLLTAASAVIVTIYASQLPGQWFGLAVAFTLICMPEVFFYGLYALFGNVLNARGSFGPYMWAPVVNNVVAIAGLLVYLWVFGGAATGSGSDPADWTAGRIALVAGTALAGVACQALVLIIPLRRSGFRFRFDFNFKGAGLGSASRMAKWTFAALALGQLGYVFLSNVAASATAQADILRNAGDAAWQTIPTLTSYTNAFMTYMLPQSLITTSLVTALFTTMSARAAEGRASAVRDEMSFGVRTIGVFSLFAGIGFAVLALPLIQTIFVTATPPAAVAYASVLAVLAFGIPAQAIWTIVQRVFYAYEDARTLFMIQIPMAAISVIIPLGAWLLLPPRWWVPGAAAGVAVSMYVGGIVGFVAMRTKLPNLDGSRILRTYLRLLLAVIPAALAGWAALHLWGPVEYASGVLGFLGAVLRLAVVGALMATIYIGLALAFGVTEVRSLYTAIRRRLPGGHSVAGSGDGDAGSPALTDPTGTDDDGASAALGVAAVAAAGAPVPPPPPREPGAGSVPASLVTEPADAAVPPPPAEQSAGGEERHPASPLPLHASGGPDPRMESTGRGDERESDVQGQVFAQRFRVEGAERTLAGGATLWTGRDLVMDQPVQILAVEREGNEQVADAVLDAARRASLIDDQRFARLLSIGDDPTTGNAIVISELPTGRRLDSLAGELSEDSARAVVGETAAALEAARHRGVQHGALTDDLVYVADDGITIAGLGYLSAAQTEDAPGDPLEASLGRTRADSAALQELLHKHSPRTEVPADAPHAGAVMRALTPWGAITLPTPPPPPVAAPSWSPLGRSRTAGSAPSAPSAAAAPPPPPPPADTSSWTLRAPEGEVEPAPEFDELLQVSEPAITADERIPTHAADVLPAWKVLLPPPGDGTGEAGDAAGEAPAGDGPLDETAELTDGVAEGEEPATEVLAAAEDVTAAGGEGAVSDEADAVEGEPDAEGEAADEGERSSSPGPIPPVPDSRVDWDSAGAAAAGTAGAGAAGGTAISGVRAAAGKARHGAITAIQTTAAAAERGRERFDQFAERRNVRVPGQLEGEENAALPPSKRSIDPGPFVLLFVLVAVVVAMFLAVGNLMSVQKPDDRGYSANPILSIEDKQAAAAEAPAEPVEEAPAPTGVPPVIASIGVLDPQGDGAENPDLTPRAFDGDPASYWRSRSYVDPAYGMKSGIGLEIVFAETSLVTEIELTLMGEGGHVQVLADAGTVLDPERAVLVEADMGRSTILTLPAPTELNSITLWFTHLPTADSDGKNRVEMAEIAVR